MSRKRQKIKKHSYNGALIENRSLSIGTNSTTLNDLGRL